MRKAIKNTLLKSLYYSGANRLVSQLYRSNPRILMLHQVTLSCGDPSSLTKDKFELLVKYIKKHYNPMKIRDIIRFRQTKGFYPDHAVVITFDDGLKSFYDMAFPILRKYDVPATVFVCPMLTEKNSWIWPHCFSYIYREGYHARCDKNLNQLLMELKKMPASKRDEFINEAYRSSSVPLPDVVPEEYRLMSWGMLKELSRSPLVEIGAHTLTHPILSMEDADTSWQEIFGSKKMLQEMLDISVHSFCFPNGHPDDYRCEHLEMLRKAEYICGIASHFGLVTPDSNEMALPRISIRETMLLSYKQLDGVEQLQRKLINELWFG